MALNIPMPQSPGSSLLQGLNTGSQMMSRLMQPILERERLKQQQDQFAQDYTIKKDAEGRQQSILPFLIQQYQDSHRTAASDAQFKEMYRNILKGALEPGNDQPSAPTPMQPGAGGVPPQIVANEPNPAQAEIPPQIGASPNVAPGLPDMATPPIPPTTPNTGLTAQEHELRPGNPRLSKLDAVAGLVPGVPKPVTHYGNGIVFTTYPSGRMTMQKIQGDQTPGEKNVSAREASKIRDQATALVNSANLVRQSYELLDNNEDLTGIGSGLASKFNVSNNPELGKFTTVTGKLQAELGKYATSRGGIQAVNWAAGVKPSAWKPEEYNYGMLEGTQRSIQDDYNTLNQQYKAATGKDLPVSLPEMKRTRSAKGKGTGVGTVNTKGKVTKWKMTGGQLVKE